MRHNFISLMRISSSGGLHVFAMLRMNECRPLVIPVDFFRVFYSNDHQDNFWKLFKLIFGKPVNYSGDLCYVTVIVHMYACDKHAQSVQIITSNWTALSTLWLLSALLWLSV